MSDSNNILPDKSSDVLSPRFIDSEPLLIVGLREALDEQSMQKIPALWQRFLALREKISHKVNAVGYGVCMQADSHSNNFYYMAGCEVTDFSNVPPDLSPIILPSQRYAVFTHTTHLSRIRETINTAFDQWLPNSGYHLAQEPSQSLHFFERYAENFNEQNGFGGIEIWLPVKIK